MKRRSILGFVLFVGLICWGRSAAFGQASQGNRAYNPFSVQFRRAWEYAVDEPIKLIEIGPAVHERSNNSLLMLVGGRDRNDYKRQLIVTHWDGHRHFATDYKADFLGTSVDALLLGRFRTPKLLSSVQVVKGKKAPPAITRQIVTTEGVYEWKGDSFARVFSAPTEIKLSLVLEGIPDHLLSGSGDKSALFEVGESDVHSATLAPPTDGGGYVHFGVGLQEFPNGQEMDIAPGIRYVQSFWAGRYKWFLGLQRGKLLSLPDAPNATTGDRLIVYTPKYSQREKTFWAIKPNDMEESWRSDTLPGRVLDVRIGDPKNEGKPGILILTAEKEDREHHLYFYAIAQPGGGIGR